MVGSVGMDSLQGEGSAGMSTGLEVTSGCRHRGTTLRAGTVALSSTSRVAVTSANSTASTSSR